MRDDFLRKDNVIAVAGASRNPRKWGYRVFMKLLSEGFRTFPLNPKEKEIEGRRCYPDLSSLPEKPDILITVTRPEVTEDVVRECAKAGIKKVWMQPGSSSEKAVEACRSGGIEVIHEECYVVDGLKTIW
jgi:uncharacterized protein